MRGPEMEAGTWVERPFPLCAAKQAANFAKSATEAIKKGVESSESAAAIDFDKEDMPEVGV